MHVFASAQFKSSVAGKFSCATPSQPYTYFICALAGSEFQRLFLLLLIVIYDITAMPNAYRRRPCKIYVGSAATADKCPKHTQTRAYRHIPIWKLIGTRVCVCVRALYGFTKFKSFYSSRKVKRFIFLRILCCAELSELFL